MSPRRIAPAAVCAIAASAILLGGCGGTSEKLSALKDDPFARYEPAGGTLIQSSETDEGSSLGKPVYASYRRLFELPPGDPEQQLRQAVDAAVAAGWTIAETDPVRPTGNLVQIGSKGLSTGEAEVGITVFPNGPPSGRTTLPAMLILLSHRGS